MSIPLDEDPFLEVKRCVFLYEHVRSCAYGVVQSSIGFAVIFGMLVERLTLHTHTQGCAAGDDDSRVAVHTVQRASEQSSGRGGTGVPVDG